MTKKEFEKYVNDSLDQLIKKLCPNQYNLHNKR